ncbi:MAG: hypothetical protein R3E64_05990 [Halioglobus sp.]
MSHFQMQSMPQEKFLLVAVNLVHQALVEATRTEAKKTYNQLFNGNTVELTTVRMEDESTASFQLSLAHSEFKGKLNFGAFRASVSTLVGNVARALREQKEIKVFNALNGGSAMIFGITAVTLENNQTNVMVLAADTRKEADATTLQLMYLDPTQFATRSPVAPSDSTV